MRDAVNVCGHPLGHFLLSGQISEDEICGDTRLLAGERRGLPQDRLSSLTKQETYSDR